jgi:glutathione S-transferase
MPKPSIPAGILAEPVLVLHDNPRSSNAQKVRLLLAELGLPYERREVPFSGGRERRPAWHLAVNPTGGIPALLDGGLALAESNAILRYLAGREGRDDLYPTALAERARVDWLLDAVATGMRQLLRPFEQAAFGLVSGRGVGAVAPEPDRAQAELDAVRPQLAAFSQLLDEASPYACLGRFTIADVAGAPYLHRLRASGAALGGLERLVAWAEACLGRPTFAEIAAEAGV